MKKLLVIALVAGTMFADPLPFTGTVVATNRHSFTLNGPTARVMYYGTITNRPLHIGQKVRGSYSRITECETTNNILNSVKFGP